MNDYDWIYDDDYSAPDTDDLPFTHHSWHRSGSIDYLNLDLFLKYNCYTFDIDNNNHLVKVYGIAGFGYLSIKMTDLGNGGYWCNSGQDIRPMPIKDETGLDYG